jgi:hypothetical protein
LRLSKSPIFKFLAGVNPDPIRFSFDSHAL